MTPTATAEPLTPDADLDRPCRCWLAHPHTVAEHVADDDVTLGDLTAYGLRPVGETLTG